MAIYNSSDSAFNIKVLSSISINYPKFIGDQGSYEVGEAREYQPNLIEGIKTPIGQVAQNKIYWYALQSNEYLITRLFDRFKLLPSSEYIIRLESHFRENTGSDFLYTRINLPRGRSFFKIKDSIRKRLRDLIDIPIYLWSETNNSLTNHIEFNYLQPLIDELPFSAVIGGIQKVRVFLNNIKLNHIPLSIGSNGTIPESFEYKINLTIEISDNFGVDQKDFEELDIASYLDGGGLTSFWVLQHQRGYKPFINKLICTNVIINDYFKK